MRVSGSDDDRGDAELLGAAIARFERGGPDALATWAAGRPDASDAARRVELLAAAGLLSADEPGGAATRARLGRYRVLGPLGAGSTGVVHLALDESLGRLVAVKELAPAFAADERVRERFRREARAIALLRHPAIVPVLEVGEHDGRAYLAMEYVEGVSLEIGVERLRARGRRPAALTRDDVARAFDLDDDGRQRLEADLPRIAATWARDLAGALAHAHAIGVVHRDVKPANVIVDRAGRPHLVDFGLAHLEAEVRVTWSADVLGTPQYLAPEVIEAGIGRADARVDVFSLGVCLHELLTLRSPFADVSVARVLRRVVDHHPPPPSRGNRRVSRDLDAVCAVATAKGPARRYIDAQAFERDLDAFLAGEPVLARTPAWHERAWRTARRRPIASTSAVAAVLFLAAAIPASLVHQERLQRGMDEARDARAATDASMAFLQELLELSDVEELGPEVPARALLAEGAERLRDAAAWEGQALVRGRLARILGGLSWGASDLVAAEELLTLALDVLAAPPAGDARVEPWLLERARAANYLGNVRRARGDAAAGARAYRDALAALEALEGRAGEARDVEAMVAANLADVLGALGELDEAEAFARRTLALAAGDTPEAIDNRAWAEVALARLQLRRKDVTAASATLEAARRTSRLLPGRPFQEAAVLDATAILHFELGDHAAAAATFERIAEIYREHVGPHCVPRGHTLVSLGDVLWEARERTRSLAAMREAEEALRLAGALDHPKRAQALYGIARGIVGLENPPDALGPLTEALELWARRPGSLDRPREVGTHALLAVAHAHRGDRAASATAAAEAERLAHHGGPPQPKTRWFVLTARAQSAEALGDCAAARAAYEEALAVTREARLDVEAAEVDELLRRLDGR